jgi:hypothetical protein
MKSIKTKRLLDLENSVHAFYPDGNTRYAPSGEPYVTIFGDRIKPEGEYGVWFSSDIEAVDKFTVAFYDYVKSKMPGLLYWRMRPLLHYRAFEYDYTGFNKIDTDKNYTCRCRVLVTMRGAI